MRLWPLKFSLTPNVADERSARRFAFVAVLLTCAVVAYFQLVDRHFFSTRFMSPIFQYLLIVNDSRAVWLTMVVCLAASISKISRPWQLSADFSARHPLLFATLSAAALAVGAKFIYHETAFSMDEYAALFQAKIFATGKLTATLPPTVIDWLVPPGFNGAFIVASRVSGAAVEAYWPGFSLMLAPFAALQISWICNPLLAGLALYLIHRITLDLTHDQRAAGWATLLAVASGAFIANAMSLYSMQAHLTLNLLFVWLLLDPTAKRALCAGFVGSLALVLHQPFPHAMFAAPWILSLAFSNDRRRLMLPLGLGYLPILAIVGVGWLRLRGVVTADNSGFNSFGSNLTSVFSIPDKSMIDMRVASLAKMWIWAVPGLFVLAALGRLRFRGDYRVRLLWASAVFTFFGYIFVIFDQGHGWGYRYFHSAWGVIPILAGCLLSGKVHVARRLFAFAGSAAFLNLVLVVPYQLMQVDFIIQHHNDELPPPLLPGRNVYFVRYPSAFYAADLVQCDPLLRGDSLILFSRGPSLDSELRTQNWPGATLVAKSFGVEEWHLAESEHWVSNAGATTTARYALHFTPSAAEP